VWEGGGANGCIRIFTFQRRRQAKHLLLELLSVARFFSIKSRQQHAKSSTISCRSFIHLLLHHNTSMCTYTHTVKSTEYKSTLIVK